MFTKLHPGTKSPLDDTCCMLDSGELVALAESKLYTLDPSQNYGTLTVYPVESISKLPPRRQPTTVIGLAGSDIYKTLPVDPTQLYPTYALAVAAAVKRRRERPNVDIGILIYFPQRSKCNPSYLVSKHYNGGIWRKTEHCFTDRISDTLVAYQTNSDFGLVRSNPHLYLQHGPVLIGHVDRFQPPGRISSALVANHRYQTAKTERLEVIFREIEPELQKQLGCFDPKILETRQCLQCNARRPKRRCRVCLVPYCDEKCQSLDWPTHRALCKAIASVRGLQLNDQSGPCNLFFAAAKRAGLDWEF